jgi:hypothetical protein
MSCSTCGATGGRCRCSENDLRDVRDRIDRACRVVSALSCIDQENYEADGAAEWNKAVREVVTLRARERELLRAESSIPRCSHGLSKDVNCGDCIEEARVEGIAQGRRELIRDLRAQCGPSLSSTVLEWLRHEAGR